MTIAEAIARTDELKPNQYTQAEKTAWLSRLDGMIYREVLSTHEDNTLESFVGYTSDTDNGTALLVPYPYDEDLYINYLQAQIDKYNGETAKYNQSISLFNNAMLTFQAYYNRAHMPVSKTIPHFHF